MRNFTLLDLREGLADLFDNRGDFLKQTQTGKLYGPILAAKRKAIDHVVDATKRPQIGNLNETDAQHDGLGAAIWHYTEAVLCHPFSSVEQQEAATRIREAFIPDLVLLTQSFADEAARARENRPKLETFAADLKRFPTSDGTTLFAWATAFVDHGERLATQLAARSANPTGIETFREQTALRVTTIGLLGRFRAALRDELAEHPDLPKDLEQNSFAYFDELTRKRAEAQNKLIPGTGV